MRNASLVLTGLALIVAACSGGSGSPTESQSSTLVLSKASVSVSGVVLNGATVPQGHGSGTSTRFEAELRDGQGDPIANGSVQIAYSVPNGGMMGGMMQGHMTLYDDGTHGDHTPGDGVYCNDDVSPQIGCHGDGSGMGDHHYDFSGMDHQGHESNHMMVVVTVTGN